MTDLATGVVSVSFLSAKPDGFHQHSRKAAWVFSTENHRKTDRAAAARDARRRGRAVW